MPKTEVLLFVEDDRSCPLLGWLEGLPQKAKEKCIVKVERLAEMGFELRRPEADFLRDGIYELRVSLQGIQYRMLYFFHANQAIISHGLIKKQEDVPPKEIDLAITHRSQFERDPQKHTYEG